MCVDEVVSIIAVIPCSAANKHILFAIERTWMTSESVTVATFSVFRNGIEIVVGITVDEIIVRTFLDKIESNSHTIVSRNIFKYIVGGIENSEVFTLSMMSLGYLNADALNILDTEIATSEQKSCDAGIRFYFREIENRAIALGIHHSDIADGLLWCSAFVKQEGYGIYFLIDGSHQIFLFHLVSTWHDKDCIAWHYERLGFGE